MAATSSPYGFMPISDLTGIPRTMRMPLGIASGYSTAIYKYNPIRLNITTGVIEAVSATTDKILGVFAGVEYTPSGGRPIVSPYWPASATYDSSYDMFVYFWAGWNPSTRFQVQADGTVAQALMGCQFNTANYAAGSAPVGLGQSNVLHAGVVASSQGQWFLEEFYTGVNSATGDAYTDLIVGVAYPQIGGGYQTSMG